MDEIFRAKFKLRPLQRQHNLENVQKSMKYEELNKLDDHVCRFIEIVTASRVEYQDRLSPGQRTKVDNYVKNLTAEITKEYAHIDSNLATLLEI